MTVHIVRLGSPRLENEGLRIGTVRRPPRGVAREAFAAQDWYDVWYPNLSPTPETVDLGRRAQTAAERQVFRRRYRKEMSAPEARHSIALLAALSHRTSFSVGCYCEDESRCHRAVLRELLREAGADVANDAGESLSE